MEPAKPPLPAPRSRPFQFCKGSQISKRMAESLVGRMIPVTRQNGGSPVKEGRDSMMVIVPEATCSARVMVVFSS